MEIPRELRWVGPLFAVLYIILWARRGIASVLALTSHFLLLSFLVPPIVFIALSIVVFLGITDRFRFASIVFFLCFFFSGIMVEHIPIPYTGPYPPPPSAPQIPFTLASPFWSMITLFLSTLSMYWTVPLIAALGMILLLLLTVLTSAIIELTHVGKLDVVQAMLGIVIVLICWTFSYIPIWPYLGTMVILTPIPLGPLVALNVLPWVPVRKIEQIESHTQ